MTPEGRVKAQVRKTLVKHGVYYFSPPANGYGRVGIPDIICCMQGKFIAIECKAKGNTPTPLQRRELEAIHNAGGVAMVVNEATVDLLDKWFEEALK